VKELTFTISGLRGIVGKNLLPADIVKYTIGFGRYITGKNIAVGRDTRVSGEMLFQAVASGLNYLGYNIYDFGICPTPAIVFATKKLKLDGGIQITASHNPQEWNGLKFISSKGRFLFAQEFDKFKMFIEKKYHRITKVDRKANGSYQNKEIIELYLKNIKNSAYFKNVRTRKLKVGIDSCNGAAEKSAIRLVEMFGAIPITINKNKIGFPRSPEPRAENLKKLSSIVKTKKLDLGIAFDPDGDRFACLDELGIPLSEEGSVLLALLFILKKEKGPVVVNNATTMAVDDICKRFKVPVYRTNVGEANVVEKMQQVGAVVGGEGNGGVILPSINYTRDGLVATAITLTLLIKNKYRLSDIRKTLPTYFMEKKVISNYKTNWQELIRKRYYKDQSVRFDRQDGLKVIGDGFWVLVRSSNTEPALRLLAESKSKVFTQNLISDTINIIK
jgi:phosphomannomutase